MNDKQSSTEIVLISMSAMSVYIWTFKSMYQAMKPSAHADESGAIGVVIFPFGAAFITAIVVSKMCNAGLAVYSRFFK